MHMLKFDKNITFSVDHHFKKLYVLGEELGKGGFGVVYSGIRRKDLAPVAIKFVRRENVSCWHKVNSFLI